MAEIAIAIAISAAVGAASAAVNYALTPKPKPLVRGRGTGDVTLQDSAFGIPINEVYGGQVGASPALNGVKVAGNIIWPPKIDIRKVTTTKKGGGKGAKTPDQVDIAYFTNIAVAFGRGPLGLIELWANTRLIYSVRTTVSGVYTPDTTPNPDYGTVGDLVGQDVTIQQQSEERLNGSVTYGIDGTFSVQLLDGSTLKWYSGTMDQPIDPTIQAETDGRLGAGYTPAYRGRAYAVIENIPYSDYNGVPNYRAVVVNLKHQNLADIVLDLAERSNVLPTDIDTKFLNGINVRGYLRAGRQAGREDLETLLKINNLESADVNGRISFVPRGLTKPIVIPFNQLGAIEGYDLSGGESLSEIIQTIVNQREKPKRVDIRYIDPDLNHNYGNQSDFLQISGSQREDTIDAPVTLLADEARGIASRELYIAHFEADPIKIKLTWRYAYIVPTQSILIDDDGTTFRFRVQKIEGAVPGVIEIDAVPEEPSLYYPSSIGADSTGNSIRVVVPATSAVEFIDVATLRDVDNESGYYVGVGPITSGGWKSASLYRQNGTDWELISQFTKPAKLGYAMTVLPAPSPCSDITDTVSTVRVKFFSPISVLESVTKQSMLNGSNVILIGNEVLQFSSAVPVVGNDGAYDLSVLLRGRKGTEYAMTTHATNERVVLLDDAIQFIPRSITERGMSYNYKAATSGQFLEDQGIVAYTYQANNLKPLTVARVRGSRNINNDLTISWFWRTRVGGQWINSVDATFVEASHLYEVEVMDGNLVKRVLTTNTESVIYLSADQISDFGSNQSSVVVRIYQINDKVGRGFTASYTI